MIGKMGSLWQNIQAGSIVRGGSTITEQYIKNTYYSGSDRTIIQKIREALTALIIENRYTKDEILRKYLSNVYMGNGLYGISTIVDGEIDIDGILDIIIKLKYPNTESIDTQIISEYRQIISMRL